MAGALPPVDQDRWNLLAAFKRWWSEQSRLSQNVLMVALVLAALFAFAAVSGRTEDEPEIVGLSNRTSVAVYRARYSDFPEPVVTRERCTLWRRQDIEAWAKKTGRL